MFAQVGGVNKKNLLSTVCVCACLRAHLQNASPCLSLDGHVLSSLCAKLPSKHTSRPHVCRHLAPRPRAASSLCPLRLSRRQPAQGSSRQRDKHPIAIKHTLAYHGRPRQGAQTKAARSLARSFGDKERRAGRTTQRLQRNYSPRPPANQPLQSIGGELVWESGQRGGEIQRRGAAGSIQKTNWLHVCVFYFVFCVLFSLWRFAGNIGAELSYSNVGMFISSDAGNSWRQVRVAPVLIFRVCSVTAQF